MADKHPLYDFMPGPQVESFSATVGEALAEGQDIVAGKDPIIAALCEVYDPEIPVSLYDLGLIYDINLAPDGTVKIDMSLTAPGCPVAGEMPGQVARAVAEVPGTGKVTVTLVWEPPWTQDLMSEDARLALGMI